MLITHKCFRCYLAVLHRTKNILVFSACCTVLPVREVGAGHKELRGDRNKTADLNWPKDLPYHMTSCKKLSS